MQINMTVYLVIYPYEGKELILLYFTAIFLWLWCIISIGMQQYFHAYEK